MKIQIPYWAKDVKDESILLLIAFGHRVTMKYGHDAWYTLHKEDCGVICNKRADGIVPWLQKQDTGLMEFAEPYNHIMMFKMPYIPKSGGRGKSMIDIEFLHERNRLIWMYILGCVNHNIIQDELPFAGKYRKNTFKVTEFGISRTAEGYVRKKDRMNE